MAKSGNKKTILLGVWLALLVSLVVVIALGNNYINNPEKRPPKDSFQAAKPMDMAKLAAQWPQIVAHAAAPPLGRPKTRYSLAEFGDFQCPQCGKSRPFLEKLVTQYPAQVNLIFIHRPFPQMHPWAIPAGQASEIAATQGKFWPLYDILYAHQDDLESGLYGGYAAKAGLNEAQFQKAFDAGQGQDRVKAAAALADSLNIEMTPTVLARDNATGTVTAYVGVDGTKLPNGSRQYPGVKDLAAAPPWGSG